MYWQWKFWTCDFWYYFCLAAENLRSRNNSLGSVYGSYHTTQGIIEDVAPVDDVAATYLSHNHWHFFGFTYTYYIKN